MPLSRMTDGQIVEFPIELSPYFLRELRRSLNAQICHWCAVKASESSFACLTVMAGEDGSTLFVAATVSCDFCGTYAKISVLDSPFGSAFNFGHEE